MYKDIKTLKLISIVKGENFVNKEIPFFIYTLKAKYYEHSKKTNNNFFYLYNGEVLTIPDSDVFWCVKENNKLQSVVFILHRERIVMIEFSEETNFEEKLKNIVKASIYKVYPRISGIYSFYIAFYNQKIKNASIHFFRDEYDAYGGRVSIDASSITEEYMLQLEKSRSNMYFN